MLTFLLGWLVGDRIVSKKSDGVSDTKPQVRQRSGAGGVVFLAVIVLLLVGIAAESVIGAVIVGCIVAALAVFVVVANRRARQAD